eukprot:GEMP01000354.1.p1 GENE.GEMP01000354.1~~GEMP01000354.1.p1  ORF type:complete len:1705 (+),score=411.12 GEMP01000354.1:160-5274(+)
MDQLECIRCGDGGVSEMRDYVDDERVLWSLLRFTTGEGAFERVKFIILHLNGDKTPIIRRGRHNARKDEVLRLMGDVHASLEFTLKEELTLDALCCKLLPLFSLDVNSNSDRISNYSGMKSMRSAYDKMLKRNRRTRLLSLPATSHASNSALPSFSECINAIQTHNPASAQQFNWMLVYPSEGSSTASDAHPRMHSAGFQSVAQIREHLEPNLVQFGLVRMEFCFSNGSKQEKYLMIHWTGGKVEPGKRAQWNASFKTVEKHFAQVGVISCVIQASDYNELGVDKIIEQVRQCAGGDEEMVSELTVDAYFEGLEEEMEQIRDSMPENGHRHVLSVSDSISMVHTADSPVNWLLLGFNHVNTTNSNAGSRTLAATSHSDTRSVMNERSSSHHTRPGVQSTQAPASPSGSPNRTIVSGSVDAALEAEAQAFVEKILKVERPSDVTLVEWLRDGIALGHVANVFRPGTVKNLAASRLAYRKVEYVRGFLNVCRDMGVATADLFDTVDLVEGKDMRKVCRCISELGILVAHKGSAAYLPTTELHPTTPPSSKTSRLPRTPPPPPPLSSASKGLPKSQMKPPPLLQHQPAPPSVTTSSRSVRPSSPKKERDPNHVQPTTDDALLETTGDPSLENVANATVAGEDLSAFIGSTCGTPPTCAHEKKVAPSSSVAIPSQHEAAFASPTSLAVDACTGEPGSQTPRIPVLHTPCNASTPRLLEVPPAAAKEEKRARSRSPWRERLINATNRVFTPTHVKNKRAAEEAKKELVTTAKTPIAQRVSWRLSELGDGDANAHGGVVEENSGMTRISESLPVSTEKAAAMSGAQWAQANEAFLNQRRELRHVQELDGVLYKVVKGALGRFPERNHNTTATFHYSGAMIDGTVVHKSLEPVTMRISLKSVLPCWRELLLRMNPGDIVEVYSPADMSPSAEVCAGLRLNSVVVYTLKLNAIEPEITEGGSASSSCSPGRGKPSAGDLGRGKTMNGRPSVRNSKVVTFVRDRVLTDDEKCHSPGRSTLPPGNASPAASFTLNDNDVSPLIRDVSPCLSNNSGNNDREEANGWSNGDGLGSPVEIKRQCSRYTSGDCDEEQEKGEDSPRPVGRSVSWESSFESEARNTEQYVRRTDQIRESEARRTEQNVGCDARITEFSTLDVPIDQPQSASDRSQSRRDTLIVAKSLSAVRWVQAVTKRTEKMESVESWLKDGTVLKDLVHVVRPKWHFSRRSKSKDYVLGFLQCAREMGVSEYELFDADDVLLERDSDRVTTCLHRFAKFALQIPTRFELPQLPDSLWLLKNEVFPTTHKYTPLPNAGIWCKTLQQGDGRERAASTSSVTFSYSGTTIDGDTFIDRAEETLRIQEIRPLGLARALQNMTVGAVWEVVVPQILAYGWSGYQGDLHPVPPYSHCIFVIRLTAIFAKRKKSMLVRSGQSKVASELDEPPKNGSPDFYSDAMLQWVGKIVGTTAPTNTREDSIRWLRDGIVLCELHNKLRPEHHIHIRRESLRFQQMDNIQNFLQGCTELGAKDSFQICDLYDGRDFDAVVRCLVQIMYTHNSTSLTRSTQPETISSSTRDLSSNTLPANRCGEMWKMSRLMWKRRYFVLSTGILRWWKMERGAREGQKSLGQLSLACAEADGDKNRNAATRSSADSPSIRAKTDPTWQENPVARVTLLSHRRRFELAIPSRTIVFEVINEDRDIWVHSLHDHINYVNSLSFP